MQDAVQASRDGGVANIDSIVYKSHHQSGSQRVDSEPELMEENREHIDEDQDEGKVSVHVVS